MPLDQPTIRIRIALSTLANIIEFADPLNGLSTSDGKTPNQPPESTEPLCCERPGGKPVWINLATHIHRIHYHLGLINPIFRALPP
jgi:hypothetical protein